MANYGNNFVLQKTSLDVKITLAHPSISQPILLHEATGEDGIIKFNAPDNVLVAPTCTGAISVANVPVLVTGEITQHPDSPASQLLAQLNNDYLSGVLNGGVVIPATLSVVSISGRSSLVFNNVFITNPYVSVDYEKEKRPYMWKFTSNIPDNLSNAVNGAGAILNLV